MKIGLISDIHADLIGLHKAISLFQNHSVDKSVCAGDLVDGTMPGEAVVQYFRAQQISTVLGNHNEYATEPDSPHQRIYGDKPRPDALTEESLVYLEQIPRTLSFMAADIHVSVAHGTPWSNMIYLFPFSERHVFQRVAHTASSDILILGHTHEPMLASGRGITILNPGSVNAARGSGTCAILTLPDISFTVYSLASAEPTDAAFVRF